MPFQILYCIHFCCLWKSKVLYMSFDKFLLAVESRDLSQADKSIIRVSSFQSWVMGSRTSFLSLNNWDLKFLQNECSQSSQIYLSLEKLRKLSRKCLLFNLANFWMIKLTKTSILPNCQVPNSFFGITVNFIIQKELWERRHSYITLVSLI